MLNDIQDELISQSIEIILKNVKSELQKIENRKKVESIISNVITYSLHPFMGYIYTILSAIIFIIISQIIVILGIVSLISRTSFQK